MPVEMNAELEAMEFWRTVRDLMAARMPARWVGHWTLDLEVMKASWRRRHDGDKIATGHPTDPFVRMAVNPDFGVPPAEAADQLLEELCAIARVPGSKQPRAPRIPNPPMDPTWLAITEAIREKLRAKKGPELLVDWGLLYSAINDGAWAGDPDVTGFLERRTGEIRFVYEREG